MKKIISGLFLTLTALSSFAQTSDDEIKKIQSYIQTTSQNEWFDPVNKTGTLENGSVYDLAYYIKPDRDTFSIIYTVFEKHTLKKIFYYRNNDLVACIVEETDPNNANKLLQYADYFYKDQALINSADEKKSFSSKEIYEEGIKKLEELTNR